LSGGTVKQPIKARRILKSPSVHYDSLSLPVVSGWSAIRKLSPCPAGSVLLSRLLGSLLLTIAEIPLERRAIQKLPAFSGPRINSRSSRLSLRLPLRRPAARGLALGSMLWLRSVLRVRPRAISVPLTRNCTELAALDAICRGLSVCNYIRERFRIPLSPPTPL